MASHNLKLSDDKLLAEYVALGEFKGLLEQRLSIGPDLMALVVRNGEVVSAAAGGHIGIGGIWRSVKDAIIGKHAIRLLIADLKPFQIVTDLHAVSRDKVQVAGEIAIEFQINPEAPSGVLGFMREQSAVLKDEVITRLAPHLGDRVIEAVIGQVDAADLRGAVAVQDKVQAEIMREVERIAGSLSLMVHAVSIRWELNPEEIAAIEKRALQREQERKDDAFVALKQEIDRTSETTKLELSTALDIEKIKAASEDELRRMMLDQELAFSGARDAGVRLQELATLEHEYSKLRKERAAKAEAAIDAATTDIDKAKLTHELRTIQRETEEFDKLHQLKLKRLEEDQRRELQEAKDEAEWKHAERVRDANIRAAGALNEVDNRDKGAKVDIDIKAADAAHARQLELKRLEQEAEARKFDAMKGQSPEVILAMNAGLSAAVANVLVEQAKAQAGNSAEVNALLREQITQARDAKIESAEQAKHFFETAMQGNVGVAQGADARGRTAQTASADGAAELVSCINPDCGRSIALSARFCHHCGQKMRA